MVRHRQLGRLGVLPLCVMSIAHSSRLCAWLGQGWSREAQRASDVARRGAWTALICPVVCTRQQALPKDLHDPRLFIEPTM